MAAWLLLLDLTVSPLCCAAPTIIAGFSTKAAQSGFNVGVYGTLTPGSGGFDMNVFETSTTKAAIPTSTGFTTTFNLRVRTASTVACLQTLMLA